MASNRKKNYSSTSNKVQKANKSGKHAKLREKIDMYDMILANLIEGNSVIEPNESIDNSHIHIGFSSITSKTSMFKYMVINQYPDYIPARLFDYIRTQCLKPGVKIDFYIYSEPYKINWDSAEMTNRMSIWRNFTTEQPDNVSVFDYRNKVREINAKKRIIQSTAYLNKAEIDYKRALLKASIIIKVTADRNEQSLINMTDVMHDIKSYCGAKLGIKVTELRVNMLDWLRLLNPFSLKGSREISKRIPKKVLSDDILAITNSYKQGKVGESGFPIGIDVNTRQMVMHHFKEDPEAADNNIVAAETGAGKSLMMKFILSFFIQTGYVVTIMDYEGDEYNPFVNYYAACDPNFVNRISLGVGSGSYYDPCVIADATGNIEIDREAKGNSINFILQNFRIMVHGLNEQFTTHEEKIMSLAIQGMYDSAGVTDEMDTWHHSKNLKLEYVFDEIREIVDSKQFVDSDNGNVMHNAACDIYNACSIYFEQGGSKYGTFGNPMSTKELFRATINQFSFGMRGADKKIIDKNVLALKQMSVAYVNILISNHCKYVKHCFNVKIWEEYQRWADADGSADIIINGITGGRKRGDVNFILTNSLGELLNDDNKVNLALRSNVQNYFIGKISDSDVRKDFCTKFNQKEMLKSLNIIANSDKKKKKSKKASSSTLSKYKHAFCILMDNGDNTIIKAPIPKIILDTDLYTSGVKVDK